MGRPKDIQGKLNIINLNDALIKQKRSDETDWMPKNQQQDPLILKYYNQLKYDVH